MLAKKVAVAMSGGVDSSVTAALLKNQGYAVFGITMRLNAGDKPVKLAAEIARKINIPQYVLDLRRPFGQKIIKPFCSEYERGRTPNPCIECNRSVKFGLLLDKARALGADYLATGHYARIETGNDGYRLFKGTDPGKDQSYFLYTLGQEKMQYVLMPLGGLYKNQTRRIAREMGFAELISGESQDICFIPESGLESFITRHTHSRPGDIVDINGKFLDGTPACLTTPSARGRGWRYPSDKRLYVLELDAKANRVVIGSLGQLSGARLVVKNLSWVSGKAPAAGIGMTVRLRYRSPGAAASLLLSGDGAEVRFAEPQRAIAPGQSAVFYSGDEVLGGGIIERTGGISGE